MAIFYPSIEEIKKEIYERNSFLIFKLMQLDDTYEVFINPYVNGDDIDFLVIKRGYGVHIIQTYSVGEYIKLGLEDNEFAETIESRIKNYKENLFNLHIESLKNKNLFNSKVFGCVKLSVHIFNDDIRDIFDKNRRNKKYINILGLENDIKTEIEQSLRPNYLFDDEIYNEMKNLFEGKFNINNNLEKITWTSKQKDLIISDSKSSKICGVAGSGKTLVLAKRATNAVVRTNSQVLILTYNITLRKYIEDKIGAFSRAINKKNFKILHFHEFINQEFNNNHIIYKATIEELDGDLLNIKNILERNKKNIKKYKSIFIDEVQDFRYEWLDIIKTYFLDRENGEYVLFGDEKQNIYNRSLDENKKSKTNIRGAWNKLTKSFRVDGEIQQLCSTFQDNFFFNKYELDDMNRLAQNHNNEVTKINQSKDNIRYLYRPNWDYEDIFHYMIEYKNAKNIELSKICILSSKVEDLRELDFMMRRKYGIYSERVFETKEQYDKIYESEANPNTRQIKLHGLRRTRKFNFKINSELIKLCTVHSFKGWESNTLFVILDKEESESKDEILYTALTRCKNNLVIINRNDVRYDEFFRTVIDEEPIFHETPFFTKQEVEYEEDYYYESFYEDNEGKIYCAEDGKYHDIEDAWMYDGSC